MKPKPQEAEAYIDPQSSLIDVYNNLNPIIYIPSNLFTLKLYQIYASSNMTSSQKLNPFYFYPNYNLIDTKQPGGSCQKKSLYFFITKSKSKLITKRVY